MRGDARGREAVKAVCRLCVHGRVQAVCTAVCGCVRSDRLRAAVPTARPGRSGAGASAGPTGSAGGWGEIRGSGPRSVRVLLSAAECW